MKGPARAHVACPDGIARGLLVLGHGAGGGVDTSDLSAARRAGVTEGFVVALVEQPSRVAGRKAPSPIATAELAWASVVDQLRTRHPLGPLVVGGRSFGARVACRTSREVGAAAVLCLAFPLVAPSGSNRAEELESVEVPVLVIQGRRDPFGMPAGAPRRDVVAVEGSHSLRKDVGAIEGAVAGWLRGLRGLAEPENCAPTA